MAEPKENQTIEETEEEANLFVVDPDDYQKTKRLESIYKTKKHVQDIRQDRSDIIIREKERWAGSTGIDSYNQMLAQAVAQYGSELHPLIMEAKENGTIDKEMLIVGDPKGKYELDLLQFIGVDGQLHHYNDSFKDQESLHEALSMIMYRRIQKIQRELGLGLEFDQDRGPAQLEEEL